MHPTLQKALRKGNFKLNCGETSEYLMDTAQILRTKEGQDYLKSIIKLTEEFVPFHSIGGPLSAADLMCPALGADKWFGVRKEAKGRGTDVGCITGNLEKGQKALIVEDVCTSGASTIHALQEVIKFGAIPVGVFVLINRNKFGGVDTIKKMFEIPVYSHETVYF